MGEVIPGLDRYLVGGGAHPVTVGPGGVYGAYPPTLGLLGRGELRGCDPPHPGTVRTGRVTGGRSPLHPEAVGSGR